MRAALAAIVIGLSMLLTVIPAQAGTIEYGHTWGTYWDDYGEKIVVDSATGCYYLVGICDDPASDETLGFLAKYGPSGDLLWDRIMDAPVSVHAWDVALGSGGEAYVTGVLGSPYGSDAVGFMAKFSADGTLVYANVIDGVQYPREIAYDASTNGFVIAGDASWWGDAGVAAFDSDGNLKWARRGTSMGFASVWGLVVDSSGNTIVCMDRYENSADVGIAMFDPLGALVDQRILETASPDEYSWDVALGPAGEVYVLGQAYSLNIMMLMRLTPTLDLVWAETVGNPYTYQEFTGIETQPDGTIYAIGDAMSELDGTSGPAVFHFLDSGELIDSTYYPMDYRTMSLLMYDAASLPGGGIVVSGASAGVPSTVPMNFEGVEVTPLADTWVTDVVEWEDGYAYTYPSEVIQYDPDALIDDYSSEAGVQAWWGMIDTPDPELNVNFGIKQDSNDPNTFTFRGHAAGGTKPYTCTYTFGDGTSAYALRTTHTFAGPGLYRVLLVVEDDVGRFGYSTQDVYVQGPPEIVGFSYYPVPALVNQDVIIEISAVDPDGGTIIEYALDFGDGTSLTTESPIVWHVFTWSGLFGIEVTVTDDEGDTASGLWEIYVAEYNMAPYASFYYTPYNATVGLPVSFNGNESYDSDGSIVLYEWWFGDGAYSAGQYATTTEHTYDFLGYYTATLMVTDNLGLTSSMSHDIYVSGGGTAVPDDYEPDNWYDQARPIYFWEVQEHSIHDNGLDTDWVFFTLPSQSVVRLYTFGPTDTPHNTFIWLYDEYGVPYYPIDWDDDSGGNEYSLIEINLPAGIYYLEIAAEGHTFEIPLYYLALEPGSGNLPPVADFYWYPWPVAGMPTTFDASWSYDPDGYIVNYSWIFSDDSMWFGSYLNHTFESAGWSWANLTVVDDDGAFASAHYNFLVHEAAVADAYEPDDTWDLASTILLGETQNHSFHNSGSDIDWVKFDLSTQMDVRIETNGPMDQWWTDTVMWLYNESGVPFSPMAFDDDSGNGYWSLLRLNLEPGTYYLEIWPAGLSDEISEYSVSLTEDAGVASWTFMVYLDGDNNLEDVAIIDFLEMASVGSTADVNIIVQMDRTSGFNSTYGDWEGTKRFYITQGMTPMPENAVEDLYELNMGDPATLISFLNWGMNGYPADNYLLCLWDHGGGWDGAVCWDDTDFGDSLTLDEVETALEYFSARPLGVLGFDACLMGMTEVAYEFKGYQDVLAFSEEVVPWDGWPYDTILADLVADPLMTPAELGQVIVTRYAEFYQLLGWGDETFSALSDSGLQVADIALEAFSQELLANLGVYRGEMLAARSASEQFGWDSADLYDFAYELTLLLPDGALKTSALDLMAALDGATIAEWHSYLHSGAHGLSIYFPTPGNYYVPYYDDIDLSVDLSWNEFIKALITVQPDIYEDDDYWYNASLLVPNEVQSHSIDSSGNDVDWAMFSINDSTEVRLTTTVSGYMDTYMALYNSSAVPYSAIEIDDSWNNSGSFIQCALAPGTYYVEVMPLYTQEIADYTLKLEVGEFENMLPYLSYYYYPYEPMANTTTVFDGSSSYDLDGFITDWFWQFSDGSSASGAYVEHVFTAPGEYIVSFQVTDNEGGSTATYFPLFVAEPLPPDEFEPDNTWMEANQIVFDVAQTHSIAPGGSDYDWVMFTLNETTQVSIGTSGPLSQWTDTVMWLYASWGVPTSPLMYDDDSGGNLWSLIRITLDPGTYYVMVGAYGEMSEIPTYQLMLQVGDFPNMPPEAVWYWYGNPYIGQLVYFEGDLSYDPDGWIVSWYWDFGDNSSSWGSNTSHVYSLPGYYWVTLTVVDNMGAANYSSQGIFIESGGNLPPVAVMSYWPSNPSPYEEVWFSASGSYDPDGWISYFVWDFGDGYAEVTYSYEIWHYFNSSGSYIVTLTVVDGYGAMGQASSTIVVGGEAPVAVIVPSSVVGSVGTPITFDGSSSYDPDGYLVGYFWNFSDGGSDGGEIVTHTFWQAGTFEVYLTVLDNSNSFDTAQVTVTILAAEPVPPLAIIAYSPWRPLVGEIATFDGSYSIDPDGTIVTWIWQFGDGTVAMGVVANHIYAHAGTYEVQLSVVDASGLIGEDVVTIVVASVPVAEFEYSPYLPLAGQPVTFYAFGSYDEIGIDDYIWSFGDGSYAMGWEVTHAFSSTGYYVVELTVRNVFGIESSHIEYVSVVTILGYQPPPLPDLLSDIQPGAFGSLETWSQPVTGAVKS